MNLLAKEYFSLQEISNIWAVSRDDYRLRLPLRHIVPVQPQLQFAI